MSQGMTNMFLFGHSPANQSGLCNVECLTDSSKILGVFLRGVALGVRWFVKAVGRTTRAQLLQGNYNKTHIVK